MWVIGITGFNIDDRHVCTLGLYAWVYPCNIKIAKIAEIATRGNLYIFLVDQGTCISSFK